jgi:hypothetical protein
MKEQETKIDLSERLRSLVKSSAGGVQGLEPLIEETIKEIMDRDGIKPEIKEKFVKRG